MISAVIANSAAPVGIVLIDPATGLPYVASGGGGGVGISAGANAITSGTVVFSNSNGVSFGLSPGGVLTATVTPGAAAGIAAFQLPNTTYTSGTVNFINSNGLSFGSTTGGGVTGSYTVPGATVFSNANNVSFGLAGSTVTASASNLNTGVGISASGSSQSVGNIVFSNSNGVTFGMAGSTVTASYTSPNATVFSNSNNVTFGLAGNTVTATATFPQPGATVFSNSNNVSFGLAGSTVTATATFGGGGAAISAAGSSQNAGTIVFSNSNGVSFGMNGSTITATVTPGAAAGVAAAAAGTQTQTSGTLVFSNSNGVTFGMSGSSQVTASVAAQTNQTLGIFGSSQTTGQSSSGTVDARSLSFVGAGIISVGLSGGSVLISGPNTTGLTLLSVGMSTGGNTVGTTGLASNQLVLAGGSNITLSGSTNAGSMTISVIGGAGGGGGGVGISAGTQSVSTGTVVFSNSNGVSFGLSASSLLTASVAAQTNQTLGIYASSQTTGQSSSSSFDARSISFVGQGVISVGLSGGSVLISAPGTTGLTLLSVGMSTGGNTVGTTGIASNQLVLAGGSNITLSGSTNAGSMTISVIGGAGGGGGAAISAAGSSQNAGTIVFSNSNGISFGMNGSTITATVTPGAAAGIAAANAGTQTATSGTLVFANSNNITFGMSGSSQVTASYAQSNQTVGLYGLGNTTQNSSSTFDARTMSLNALGAMTVGFTNGSIQLSAPATSSLSATGILSISVNGSTISIGVPPQGYTESGFNPYADLPFTNSQIGNGTLVFDPNLVPSFQYDRVLLPIMNSNATNSSGSHSLSFWVGLYTRNASTLSLLGSTSRSTAVTHSGTVGSYSLFSGIRHITIGSTTTLSAGRYWMAFVSNSSSAGADGSYSNIMQNVPPTVGTTYNFNGLFGVAQNNTQQFTLGQGFYSATTTGMPASIAFSQINGVTAGAENQQFIMFASSTV